MAECRKHQAEHGSKTGCVLVEPYPYFVRYGDPETLASYIETRSFLWNSEQQTKKPRIPKLIHQFRVGNGQGTAYAVLEHIKPVQSPDDLDKRIEDAVTWLSGVQAPSDHKLGPLGGGCIRHVFFESVEAPLPFVSVKALQRYIDKLCVQYLYFLAHPSSIIMKPGTGAQKASIQRGRRRWRHAHGGTARSVCVQATMDASHFGVDEEDNTILMGLGNISFLPETFAR